MMPKILTMVQEMVRRATMHQNPSFSDGIVASPPPTNIKTFALFLFSFLFFPFLSLLDKKLFPLPATRNETHPLTLFGTPTR